MQSTQQQTYPIFGTHVSDTGPFEAWGGRLPDIKATSGVGIARQDPVGFQGEDGAYTDYETGLVLMGHRYYDTGTGRFLNRDPLGYGGGINLYGFAGNNPINDSDPSGLNPFWDWLTGTKLKRGTPTIGGAAAEKRREIQELTAGPEDDAGVNQTMQADPRNHLSRVGPAVSGGLATMGGIIATGALGAGAEGIGGEEVAATTSEARFAPGRWFSHYQKHMAEFPEISSSVQYFTKGTRNRVGTCYWLCFTSCPER